MPPADLTPDSQRARGGGSGVAAVGARPEENGTKREAKTAMGVVGSPGRGRRVLRAINLSWRDSPLRSFALPASGTPYTITYSYAANGTFNAASGATAPSAR